MTKTLETFAVWWASAGCLPDSETPAFTGTFSECLAYTQDDPDEYFESVGDYNLYTFIIEPHEEEENN
jgi:hypothetical protein